MLYQVFFDMVEKYFITIDQEKVIEFHKESIEHMIRCSKMANDFGSFLRLDDFQLNQLYESALLHDIGKLKINPSILYKNSKLVDEEFAYIKTHTNLDGNIGLLNGCILDCINYHHDNICGTGYNKVNVYDKHEFVRIISLIDCYDAMSNKRCYKNFVFSLDEIIEDIEGLLGKQFDHFYGRNFIKFLKETKKQEVLPCIS